MFIVYCTIFYRSTFVVQAPGSFPALTFCTQVSPVTSVLTSIFTKAFYSTSKSTSQSTPFPLVLFRTKNLINKTKQSVVTLLKNSIVSALFFAVDATVVKYGLCLLRNAWGKPPPVPHFLPFLAGLLGSLGLLIERQSRRVELLYYVLPQVYIKAWM